MSAALVAVGVLALSLPFIVARTYPYLSPDVVNYLSSANALAHGSGLVDPVQWHGYLHGGPPKPAWAILSPVVCIVLALPIALGATVVGTIVAHASISAGIAGLIVVVARRSMRMPAALACGIGFGWTLAWAQVSFTPLTEPYAVLGILAVVASAPGVTRSHRGVLLCAAATVVGWMTRANVPVLALAVVFAAAWGRPWRDALGDRRIWMYVLVVIAAIAGIRATYAAMTGFAPYANYAAFFEMFVADDLTLVEKDYIGARAFAAAHSDQVVARWGQWLVRVVEELLLEHTNHHVALLLPLALTWGVFGGGKDARDVARRTASSGAVLFAASTIFTWGGFEERYVLPAALCLWLGGMSTLDAALGRLAPGRHVAALAPLVVVLGVFAATTLPEHGMRALRKWQAAGSHDWTRMVYERERDGQLRKLCRHIDARFIAAARSAEALHFWCGAPVMRLPHDVAKRGLLRRFVETRGVQYLVVERGSPAAARVRNAAMFRLVKRTSDLELYERTARGRPVWRPPPSLACIGGHPACPVDAPPPPR